MIGLFMFHVYHAVLSVPCSLVVTWWERPDLLALLCAAFSCVWSLSHMCLCVLIHTRIKGEVGTINSSNWFY